MEPPLYLRLEQFRRSRDYCCEHADAFYLARLVIISSQRFVWDNFRESEPPSEREKRAGVYLRLHDSIYIRILDTNRRRCVYKYHRQSVARSTNTLWQVLVLCMVLHADSARLRTSNSCTLDGWYFAPALSQSWTLRQQNEAPTRNAR